MKVGLRPTHARPAYGPLKGLQAYPENFVTEPHPNRNFVYYIDFVIF